MNRFAFFTAVSTLSLLAASCSKDQAGNVESSAGGATATTGVGGSGVTDGSGGVSTSNGSGSTTISGGATNTSGSSAVSAAGGSIGVGGTGAASAAGGSIGVGGTGANTSAAAGGASASGGIGATTANTTGPNTTAAAGGTGTNGGATGSGGTKGSAGATTGAGKGGAGGSTGSGKGGSIGTGGKPATGGMPAMGGSGIGGASGVGGATATAGAPGSTPSAGCGKTATFKSGRASINVPNVTDTAREYILALPTNYDPTHAYKLIFAWHPWTGSAQMIANGSYYGLQKEANNEAIFVAAEGLNFTQNGQSGLGWGNANGEDVAFYHSMLDLIRQELCIDEERIFSVGFSFGAMFSFTLGCTAESMTRAIVPMAGNTFTSGGCATGTRSVAVMALIGLQDTLLDGHRQAVSTYANRDGCTTTTQTMSPSWCDGLSASNLPCTCVNYQGCKQGYPVMSCEYTAGHQQAPNPGPIWDFLAQF